MSNCSAPTVLIVEDEAIVAADVEERLRRIGYRTLGPAASGREALNLARAQPPQIALTDIRLQGAMDGIALAEVLRGELEIPVVFLSAHADRATIDRAQVAEPLGYLLKPFDNRLLEITLQMALYKHQAEAERKRLAHKLEQTENELRVLSGLIATCSYCHKIEDSNGEWLPIETYVSRCSHATFSHTYCPTCLRREFPDIAEKVLSGLKTRS